MPQLLRYDGHSYPRSLIFVLVLVVLLCLPRLCGGALTAATNVPPRYALQVMSLEVVQTMESYIRVLVGPEFSYKYGFQSVL